MVGAGTHKMLHPSWVSVSAYVSEYWSVIIATVVFAFVGAVTIYYTVNQLNKNISLSLIKAIKARAKRYKKWKDKVPAASHKRVLEVRFTSSVLWGDHPSVRYLRRRRASELLGECAQGLQVCIYGWFGPCASPVGCAMDRQCGSL